MESRKIKKNENIIIEKAKKNDYEQKEATDMRNTGMNEKEGQERELRNEGIKGRK